ncbi:hypothetical protein HY3_11890 [Hyphomonas pacifica]|uniref:Uncharacterized protein n=1 Tax=Hyphomonas pacifica TaxID=1280941 RepID=A0A062U152_9PROT|nr:hypothetical protein HY2_15635 [Hyphomonas pacifica]RAN33864.1 hypothetical protein HY3_11890 [Hyphomonas pacifica]RAN38125.1 hypothetical protein HY11_07625 [Hyphomonas pacifica]
MSPNLKVFRRGHDTATVADMIGAIATERMATIGADIRAYALASLLEQASQNRGFNAVTQVLHLGHCCLKRPNDALAFAVSQYKHV